MLESLTINEVLDKSAVVEGDIRVDASGHKRFTLFLTAEMEPRRVGRVIQRMCEVEFIKACRCWGVR